jgi:hypothetical protein
MRRSVNLRMTKEKAIKAHINDLDRQIRDLELEMDRLRKSRDDLICCYQRRCKHTFGKIEYMYGYPSTQTCTKCGLEQ